MFGTNEKYLIFINLTLFNINIKPKISIKYLENTY